MLEFEVVPEQGLRNEYLEFQLGISICTAINILQKYSSFIKHVDLIYNQESPLSQEITIALTSDGVKLIFDSLSQRLRMIEVYDLTKVTLKYCSNTFSSTLEKPTVENIDKYFGATHPGVYDSTQQVYVLSWRGLSFSFPVESNLKPHYAHGLSSLQFPNGSSPLVSKMFIYSGNSVIDAKAPELPLSCFHGNVYLETLKIQRANDQTLGVVATLISETLGQGRFAELQATTSQRTIRFHDSCQDVLSALGCPNRVFYKSEDKMKIHLPSSIRKREDRLADFFFNYFTLGLDVMFDAETHQAKKFVLHTNYPGHYDFGIFHRCNFKLELSTDCNESYCMNDSVSGAMSPCQPEPGDGGKRPVAIVTPFTKWNDIHDLTMEAVNEDVHQQPVVLNRASSGGSCPNPFGSTFCYAYQDIIFEVMANGHLASLTLCSPTCFPL